VTTLHEIALLRLAALRITGPRSANATETVRWLSALQAQDYNGTWKHTGSGMKRTVAATPFRSFSDEVIEALAQVYAALP